jgi:hypothetical protein
MLKYPVNLITNPLRATKYKLSLKDVGMYNAPCEHGKEYVWQTGRTSDTRCKEHMTGAAREVSGGRPDLKQDTIST